jgi:hypothetical protein
LEVVDRQQRNLAAAVATGREGIPELVSELRSRNERIRRLELDLASARRTPATIEDTLRSTETAVRRRVADLRAALSEPGDAREVFEGLFLPEGLTFAETCDETGQRGWAVTATAHLARSVLLSDPRGN